MQNLVIVESPTKSRTLSRFLGKEYQIEASMGHVRDLPKSDFGIDIEKNFEPLYIIPRDKLKRVNELKKISRKADQLWLATDPDREGEAIAWHIAEILRNLKEKGKKVKNIEIKRVEFHEITPEAIKEAFDHPRIINMRLVDAQQARRVLDRLVGYKLSPLLWKKIKRGLSAGRVQSIAVRLIVEREREIEAFKAVEYWSIEALVDSKGNPFTVELYKQNDKKLIISNEEQAKAHLSKLKVANYKVDKIAEKKIKRHPVPPFNTSTLQQTAFNKLHFTSKKTMILSQNLYERGFITYIRTDSLNIAQSAISSTRNFILQKFGRKYLPSTPKFYKSKSKNAQEAHEAIRPTNVSFTSEQFKLEDGFGRDHLRLYDLIWKRMVASQMNEAIFDQTTVDVSADEYGLRANGSVIVFDGWLKIYGVTEVIEDDSVGENKKQVLPKLTEGEELTLIKLDSLQHFTQPPPRYTEAALIKKLEELGIGRPSTYAPILSTIQERYYVEKVDRKFKPSALGIGVNDFLIKHFPAVFDYKFTAQMEDNLDEIARGERQWRETIGEFYAPFEKNVEATQESAEKVKLAVEITDKVCPDCGKGLVVRFGRFGKFLACSGFPDCKHTEAIEVKVNALCPQDGGEIVVRKTKKNKVFYGCKNWPKCSFASWTKPKQESSPKSEPSQKLSLANS